MKPLVAIVRGSAYEDTFHDALHSSVGGRSARADLHSRDIVSSGSAVVSWIELANQATQFRIRRVDPTGTRSPSVTVAGIGAGRASGYPRVSRRGNELLFAWTETSGDGSRVLTAAAPLPSLSGTRD